MGDLIRRRSNDLVRVTPRSRREVRAQSVASSLTAAARILPPTLTAAPRPEAWHPDAWFMRDNTGELRHAENWLGNSMGRARLVAAQRRAPGAEPEPLPENHPAQEALAELAGGVGGQAALLRSWGTYMMTPGVGYMLGLNPRDGGGFTWQVRSAEEIRLGARVDDDGEPMYEVQTGDASYEWEPLPGGIVVKVHRPDPRRHWRPDSPVRGALGILHELFTLTQAIQASAVSRLAGAGVFAIPQEIDFPGGFVAWLDEFMKAVTQPIRDRDSAAAYVPFVTQIKGEWIQYLKHITFSTPFDEHAIRLREELLSRLATAMDMPARALTGEQENHWGKAITAEEGVKIHVQPNLELVCDGITKGYLLPALLTSMQAQGADLDIPPDQRQLAEFARAENVRSGDGWEIVAWYDLSDFTAKADKSDDAVAGFDRFEVGGEALRAETGLSEWAPPDDAEVHRRLLIEAAKPGGDAAIQRASLLKLGVFEPDELPLPAAPEPPGAGPEEPEETEEEVGGEPATDPGDPAPSEDPAPPPPRPAIIPAAATVDRALVAASDQMVRRALEKAGNRLRNVTRAHRTADASLDVGPGLMHTVFDASAVWLRPEDLLEGAWDWLGDTAGFLDVDAVSLRASLDTYTRELIKSRRPHSLPLLEAFLAAAPPPPHRPPAERVLAALGRSS